MPRELHAVDCALTIAGSDSGGGAGIQADLKTFAALGVHGATVITCITAQNSKRVQRIEDVSPKIVRAQFESVFAEFRPCAVKTGMLHTRQTIDVVADFFETRPNPPLIVDPVIIATSGTRLLQANAFRSLCDRLLPLAELVTPNLNEACKLVGVAEIRSLDQMRHAARTIHGRWGCNVLVKGGHLQRAKEAVDVFWDGKNEILLQAPFVKGVKLHGTGCRYSAAIAAHVALGAPLVKAVVQAKRFVHNFIQNSRATDHARQ